MMNQIIDFIDFKNGMPVVIVSTLQLRLLQNDGFFWSINFIA